MKLTYQQDAAVREYLNRYIKYNEVKAEMYDHVMTALEHTPEDSVYGEAMNTVMNDIGGIKGLKAIQRSAKRTVIKAMVKQYLQSGKLVLSSFWMLPVICITGLAYFILPTGQPFMELFGIPFMGYLTGSGVRLWQKATRGYTEGSVVTAAFDTVVPFIQFLPVTILLIPKMMFFSFELPFPPVVFVSIIFLCLLHVATAIKFSSTQFDKANGLVA
ncbi:hypothetical protein [Mucilaginibacter myungsuensis]|uniref:Uncharacterized protein n=1 Tax=Mucilaginibacter myungsuensis TaxID=649104 RepID=A0A929PXL3_9SPHI|nr:hypothetical protein [Mucilaginibacter myungsuensis]MBE9662377.1 hypothetical protein [Mucilaginibacter myungsuensis]MDN3599186.1 hypothetical protein [Mucilaginibacter myungsuensis]